MAVCASAHAHLFVDVEAGEILTSMLDPHSSIFVSCRVERFPSERAFIIYPRNTSTLKLLDMKGRIVEEIRTPYSRIGCGYSHGHCLFIGTDEARLLLFVVARSINEAKGIVACFDLSTPERKLVWSFQVGPRAVTGILVRGSVLYTSDVKAICAWTRLLP